MSLRNVVENFCSKDPHKGNYGSMRFVSEIRLNVCIATLWRSLKRQKSSFCEVLDSFNRNSA